MEDLKIIDLYSKLRTACESGERGYSIYKNDPELQPLERVAKGWEIDVESAREWFKTPDAIAGTKTARRYIAQAPEIIRKVEAAFSMELPGTVILAPSYAEFDGFARYDRGEHLVLLGIDFPGADEDYLKALTAHELSHVYRDHAPEVWRHLGKPLSEVSRKEYLDAGTAQEHLVSEGLATLFSQALCPEIPARVHHYYDEEEWQWCESHFDETDRSLRECLRTDEDVWSYYSESRVAPGSPPRLQYHWAARVLSARLDRDRLPSLVRLHALPTAEFREFF